MGILVDTSVWVQHFKTPLTALTALLRRDALLTHPLVIGEIMCGTPPNRASLRALLLDLARPAPVTLDEVLDFMDAHGTYGKGCGVVDTTVLPCAWRTPGARLWTLDRRLQTLAQTLDVAFAPAP